MPPRVLVTSYGSVPPRPSLAQALAHVSIAHAVVKECELPSICTDGTILVIDHLDQWRETDQLASAFMSNMRTLVAAGYVSRIVPVSPSPGAAMCLAKLEEEYAGKQSFRVYAVTSPSGAARTVLRTLLVHDVVTGNGPTPMASSVLDYMLAMPHPVMTLHERMEQQRANVSEFVAQSIETFVGHPDTLRRFYVGPFKKEGEEEEEEDDMPDLEPASPRAPETTNEAAAADAATYGPTQAKPPAASLAARLAAHVDAFDKGMAERVAAYLTHVDRELEILLTHAARVDGSRMLDYDFPNLMGDAKRELWDKLDTMTRNKIQASMPDHVAAFAKANGLGYTRTAPDRFVMRW